MYKAAELTELYRDEYSDVYEKLYLAPWPEKHHVNLQMLRVAMKDLPANPGRWLDLCCGQAWFFKEIETPLQKVGIDLSGSQLKRAAARNPSSLFIQADISQVNFPPGAFSLVSSFWAAYCYLDDESTILETIRRAASWIAPGGAFYLEVLPPANLASFNASPYAARTGFRVKPRTPDYSSWGYSDLAGEHLMYSPSLERFTALFQQYFERVHWTSTGFMVNLLGRSRRASMEGEHA